MRTNAKQFILRQSQLMAVATLFTMVAAGEGMAQQGQQLQGQSQQLKSPQQGQAMQPQPSQQQQQRAPWTKLCGKVKTPAEGQEQAQDANLCLTFLERLDDKTGKVIASAGIRQQEGGKGQSLVVTVPLGVSLRGDTQAKIDGGKPIKLDFTNCNVAGCIANANVTAEFVAAMKAGKEIVIDARGPRGKPVSFAMPLTGFATAFDGPPSDTKQYQGARQQLINAIRARRAEQLNKALQELDKQQQAPQQRQQPQPQQ